ncbi:hypothetical protein PJG4_088 [Pseudomonas phage JG004]|uniref:Uncharacterized protein n=1 Tax=Pseudomonas phage JG004 TaxID=757342 RepID=F4YDQ2_9CAUD|nr:holin [Pseudomonas phage JG004]ADF58200.1 hypothetical protein PJG4_088 [Pseudomonas phage JG004]
MKKLFKSWKFWAAVGSATFMALEAMVNLWEPILPPGVFAAVATLVAVGVRISAVFVTASKVEEAISETIEDDTIGNDTN